MEEELTQNACQSVGLIKEGLNPCKVPPMFRLNLLSAKLHPYPTLAFSQLAAQHGVKGLKWEGGWGASKNGSKLSKHAWFTTLKRHLGKSMLHHFGAQSWPFVAETDRAVAVPLIGHACSEKTWPFRVRRAGGNTAKAIKHPTFLVSSLGTGVRSLLSLPQLGLPLLIVRSTGWWYSRASEAELH